MLRNCLNLSMESFEILLELDGGKLLQLFDTLGENYVFKLLGKAKKSLKMQNFRKTFLKFTKTF